MMRRQVVADAGLTVSIDDDAVVSPGRTSFDTKHSLSSAQRVAAARKRFQAHQPQLSGTLSDILLAFDAPAKNGHRARTISVSDDSGTTNNSSPGKLSVQPVDGDKTHMLSPIMQDESQQDQIFYEPSSTMLPFETDDFARWGVPTWVDDSVERYSDSHEERRRRYSWEPNPAAADGKLFMGFGPDLGRRRLTQDAKGGDHQLTRGVSMSDTEPTCLVGYEQSVLDMEALLHEAVASISGDRHTFYPTDAAPPKIVLCLGTGLGLWPIEMARQWPQTTFIGMDIAPIQTDLKGLAAAQQRLRKLRPDLQSSDGGGVDWKDLSERITWKIGDLLKPLPFDSGTIDMVHMRFVGLSVPEHKWQDLIDEAGRVLKRDTGVVEVSLGFLKTSTAPDTRFLQITEMTKSLPKGTPPALRASFESLLTASFISNRPQTVIRPALAMSGLAYKEVFNKSCSRSTPDRPEERVLGQVMATWADSALGKGLHGRGNGVASQLGTASSAAGLPAIGAAAMVALEGGHQQSQTSTEATEEDKVTLTTWIVKKSSK